MAATPAAEHKVLWVVLAVISILDDDHCRASAQPQQRFYTSPGFDGTWRWQTPEGSAVLIQYPLNSQGFVPWTPAGFSYSISSDPARSGNTFDQRIHSNFLDVTQARIPSPTFRSSRKLNIQIPNNNPESSIFLVRNQNNGQNENKVEEEIIHNAPVLFRQPISKPIQDNFHVPSTANIPTPQQVQAPVSEIDLSPRPIINRFSGPVTEKFPDTVVNTILDPATNTAPRSPIVTTESSIEFNTERFIPDNSPEIRPLSTESENKINNNFNIFSTVNRFEEANDQNRINNDFNDFSNVNRFEEANDQIRISNNFNDLRIANRNEQLEDPTEFEPVVRLTSCGRPQRRRLTTRKPALPQRRVNRPEPRLLQVETDRNRQVESNRPRTVRLTSRGRPQLLR